MQRHQQLLRIHSQSVAFLELLLLCAHPIATFASASQTSTQQSPGSTTSFLSKQNKMKRLLPTSECMSILFTSVVFPHLSKPFYRIFIMLGINSGLIDGTPLHNPVASVYGPNLWILCATIKGPNGVYIHSSQSLCIRPIKLTHYLIPTAFLLSSCSSVLSCLPSHPQANKGSVVNILLHPLSLTYILPPLGNMRREILKLAMHCPRELWFSSPQMVARLWFWCVW